MNTIQALFNEGWVSVLNPPPQPHIHTDYKCGEWERSFFCNFVSCFQLLYSKKEKKSVQLPFFFKELRGRPIDSYGGRGAGKFGRDRLFIFSLSLAGKLIFKKKKKTRGRGSECWLKRETRQVFPCDCLFLQNISMRMQSVCKCMLENF